VVKASFHRSCVRQRIARAEKSGLTLREAEDESDLKEFYRLHSGMRKRLGLPAPPWHFLRALWRTFFPIGQLSLLLSTWKTKVVGGIILLKFKERVSAEFLGWDETYRDVSPTHHLFWEGIKAAHAEGRRIFDFGRSSPVDTGLSTFKSRWGTSPGGIRHYYYPPDYSAKTGERDGSLAYRAIRHACRTLPEPAFRLVGMFCYRHLA
jgi:lipid II:glycine glycyltransferase (peptidoglycan interpeptide bridge formation enzyme)